MTNLLLNNNEAQQRDDQQRGERYLVEIISCCVKQAATGEYPIARRTQNRKSNLILKFYLYK